MTSLHNDPNTVALCDLILTAAEGHTLRKAVFSKSRDTALIRAVATLREIGKQPAIQIERFHFDHKATHENLPLPRSLSEREALPRSLSEREVLPRSLSEREALLARLVEFSEGFAQINLITTAGTCEFRSSKSGKTLLTNGENLRASLKNAPAPLVPLTGNNREKQYILTGKEPFLMLLGISDRNGRVYDKKQSKFRQINRFLEEIRDVLAFLPKDEITVADLCCGKSYLTFATYHYFSEILGMRVRMFGADLKPDVIDYCIKTADELHFDGLSFLCTDIRAYTPPQLPDLVISLHACDTATDIVLEKAVEWQAKVILSTPCYHHELNHTLSCPELAFLAEHSMLRQKFCDAATDALRLKKLQTEGYRTEALELIDPEETPKNILLRAVRRQDFSKDSSEGILLLEEYEDAKRFLVRMWKP